VACKEASLLYLQHYLFVYVKFLCGNRKLKELSKRTTFIRVTQQINEVFGEAPHHAHVSQLAKGNKRSSDEISAGTGTGGVGVPSL
jgi:hypothetical protein